MCSNIDQPGRNFLPNYVLEYLSFRSCRSFTYNPCPCPCPYAIHLTRSKATVIDFKYCRQLTHCRQIPKKVNQVIIPQNTEEHVASYTLSLTVSQGLNVCPPIQNDDKIVSEGLQPCNRSGRRGRGGGGACLESCQQKRQDGEAVRLKWTSPVHQRSI